MSVIRRTAGVLVAVLLPVVASAKPAVKSDVTAVGFTEWTGVLEKNHLAGRLVCSSDLRHKVTIVAVLESDAKLRDQLAIVSTIMPRIHHVVPESGIDDWAVPRDYVGIVSCRGAVTCEALGAALKPVANEPQDITEAIRLVVGSGSGAFRDADFVGAADPAGKEAGTGAVLRVRRHETVRGRSAQDAFGGFSLCCRNGGRSSRRVSRGDLRTDPLS